MVQRWLVDSVLTKYWTEWCLSYADISEVNNIEASYPFCHWDVTKNNDGRSNKTLYFIAFIKHRLPWYSLSVPLNSALLSVPRVPDTAPQTAGVCWHSCCLAGIPSSGCSSLLSARLANHTRMERVAPTRCVTAREPANLLWPLEETHGSFQILFGFIIFFPTRSGWGWGLNWR